MEGELTRETAAAPQLRCPNCDEAVTGEYCSACGQRQRSYRQALHRVFFEFLGELFEVDGRVLKSLRLLLLRPGLLTVEFFADRRASYLTPIRLYLASSLVFFFLLSTTTGFELDFGEDPEQVLKELDPAERQAVDDALKQVREKTPLPIPVPEVSTELQKSLDPLEKSHFEQALEERVAGFLADPSGASEKLIDNLPLAAFMLLPLFALLLKLFYPARFLVEHVVFALHLHACLFLLLGLRLLLPSAEANGDTASFWGTLRGVLLFGCLVYAGVALKVFYAQSLRRTMLKGAALTFCYGLLLGIALVATVVGTVLA